MSRLNYLLTYLLAYLLTCLLIYLPTYLLAYLLTYLLTEDRGAKVDEAGGLSEPAGGGDAWPTPK